MLRILKPYVGPVVIMAGQALWELFGGGVEPLLNGLLFGFAGFWLLMSSFGNRALMKKYPGILEWLPFLDPAGGFATPKQLTAKHLSGHTISIADMVRNSAIVGRTFYDCDIHGPAVLAATSLTHMKRCKFDAPLEAVAIVATHQKRAVGLVQVDDCTFDQCRFHNIGIVGDESLRDAMRAEMVE